MHQNITPQDLQKRISAGETIRIVDVRSRAEFASGHLPGAENIPLGAVQGRLEGIGGNEVVALVCHSGGRSEAACARVKSNHPRAMNLDGGVSAWRRAGFELVRGPRAPRSLDRQTHFVAGTFLITALLLFRAGIQAWWIFALLPAFGLMLDALTGICPMTLMLKRLPWNAEDPQSTAR